MGTHLWFHGNLSLVSNSKGKNSNTICTTTISNEWEMNINQTLEKEEEEEGEDKEEQEKARREWDFSLCTTVVTSSSIGSVSDTISVIEFDPSDRFIVTGGLARKIRLYRLQSLIPPHYSSIEVTNISSCLLDHTSACDYYICAPAKLSSLRWKPGADSRVVGSGDYDGVVTEYDLERQTPIFERDEHGGRRVWSVDYSHWGGSQVGASGSDDGTMQVWDTRLDNTKCVAVVQPSESRSPICCVEFDPCGGQLVAIGCADRNAYTYDVRNMMRPVSVFLGHQKTVSYVRFSNGHTMVSAGTDGCLKLWDMDNGGIIRTYKGHINCKSFVGLSVWRSGGLIGCGSESNEVFVYDKRWSDPIWVRGLEQQHESGCSYRFVSSVCWRQKAKEEDECAIVTGGSDGDLQVFLGKRRSPSLG
ncbi:hypothetical protein GIB67_008015 [Kingdonia uniflora]|uniref:Uncharacterized protein n=1 Tax=Kingdonia uniflora TaxID=39325 RepID=A0A7J7MXI2_9MAGN|nr:hypothetical protein GIB67_008015 [Kingdonia uniflora]